ncbi:pirin family protein [Pedobacter sp. AW31-3R]|uniref:pirin family protein n=1 Tax=Pedobacter sp. AW31-3R TaxID=3445781 RepID=UPI003FA06C77
MEPNLKAVSAVLKTPAPHMVGDGFNMSNFFPGGNKIKMSPFFLLDYHVKTVLPPYDQPKGVGVHPHRGFETVTIAYHGAVAHHDSAGNSGIIYPGDVQWMTAGRGILHKEYHEQTFSENGGPFQIVQLWVNLPAKDKMTNPRYQPIKKEDTGKYILPENAGTLEVIAGTYEGITGPASTFTDIQVYNAQLRKDSELTFSFPEVYNTGMLMIEGSAIINGKHHAAVNEFIHFRNEGTTIQVRVPEDSVILVLSGQPINEPIAQYGPFLMNNQAEIKQAISDYNQGLFGYLEE